MKRLFILSAIASLLVTMLSPVWAASNLNLSKSNINRLVYSTDVMNPTQATAVLKELDRSGQVGEAQVRQILQRHGVRADSVKRLFWEPPGKTSKLPTLILLTNPADGPAAIAVSDPGMPAEKPMKKSAN